MKWIAFIALIFASFLSAEPLFSQTTSPTATPEPTPTVMSRVEQLEAEKLLIDKETELLESRRKYLEVLKNASGNSSATRDNVGGKTEYAVDAVPIFETVELSYEAVREIATQIDQQLTPRVSGYDRVVFYYDKDFTSLSRYRLYRTQASQALANYDALIKLINAEAERTREKVFSVESADRSVGEALITALSMPSIVSGGVKSIADLISLFRTDRTITQSSGTVDEKALDTLLAGVLMKNHPGIRIYNPDQFVPEYEFGIGERGSFYDDLSRISMADAYLDAFLNEMSKAGVDKAAPSTITRLVASARVVKAQLHGLTFSLKSGQNSAEQPDASEFRQMVRAEKLDRFIRPEQGSNAKTAILLVRLLRSGGSRRESRNLILGSRTDYSGSAFVEVALYDADGALLFSDVFNYHTGFRKFKTGN